MASDRTIDDIDGSILDILQYNARTSQAELAKAVGLAPSAVLERLRKLEAKGIILDYVAIIDPLFVDLGMLAFVAVMLGSVGFDGLSRASFWQDWYGIIPLLVGSLMVSAVALALAVPLGVGAAIYVNQIEDQRLEKVIANGTYLKATERVLNKHGGLHFNEIFFTDVRIPDKNRLGDPGMGWTRFASLAEQAGLPVFAIGGQSAKTLADARNHGAHGIAGIRHMLDNDPA